MKAFDVEMGLRQTAAMLRSGVPLLSALETVAEQAANKSARTEWARVAHRVTHGEALAEAFAARIRCFGEVTVRLAEVGERSGELERTLSRAADQMDARRTLRNSVINALVYPAITVIMALAVSTYLVIAVIPKLSEFLRSSDAVLPALTQTLMDLSDWIIAHGASIAGSLGILAAAWIVVRASEAGRELQDAFLMRLPVAGRILRLSGTALFSRAMQIMLESGVPLTSALDTAARLLANRRLRRRIEAAHCTVLAGQPLSGALRDARELMPMLARMTAVGERTGSLPEIFDETARFHEMLLALAIKRLGMLIEPVMIAVTGIIVGFVYVAFFMALFSIAGAG